MRRYVTGGASLVVKLTSDYSVHNAGFKVGRCRLNR